MGVIEKLEELLKAEKFYEVYELLKVNINRVDQNNNVVLQCINALIDNDYIEDADELVSSLYLRKSKRIMMKIFKNKIKDKRKINDYDENVYKVYFDAREVGHDYYQLGAIEEAYYTYEWGYYVTENPVFLYYIGKMIYKTRNYKLAEEYFKKYLKHCGEKTSKTYLYLACISHYYRRMDEAETYIDVSNRINEVEKGNYYIDNFNISVNDTVDYLQLYNEFIAESLGIDYVEEITDCPEFYEISKLYNNGDIEQAKKLFEDLENKLHKNLDDKMAIGLLRCNQSLYNA